MQKLLTRQIILSYCLAAALPLMLLALLFNYPVIMHGAFFPGTDYQVLGYVMQAEFLAAASGILIILPLLFPSGTRFGKWLRIGVFALFGYIFAWIAYEIDGTTGMLYYALLVFVTFGGGTLFVFDWLSSVCRTFLSLLRWSVAIFAYVSYQLYFDLDVDISLWRNTRQVIPFGAVYFYTLFALEVLVYPVLTYYLEQNLSNSNKFDKAVDAVERVAI